MRNMQYKQQSNTALKIQEKKRTRNASGYPSFILCLGIAMLAAGQDRSVEYNTFIDTFYCSGLEIVN